MIQSQLLTYITAQLKSGVSRDAVKNGLVGVGWQPVDVEDSLKKAEDDMKASATVSVAAAPAARPAMSSLPEVTPIAPIQPSAAPASAPMSTPFARPASMASFSSSPMDMVSGAGAAPGAVNRPMGQPVVRTPAFSPAPAGVPSGAVRKPDVFPASTGSVRVSAPVDSVRMSSSSGSSGSGSKIPLIIAIVAAVVLAIFSVYLFIQNTSLGGKVSTLNSTSGSAVSAESALQSQVQMLTASDTALQAQVTAAGASVTELQSELGFFVVPATATGTEGSASIMGVLAASGSAHPVYNLRTVYGSVIFVQNSNDPKIASALSPLVGASVSLSGSYVYGSGALMVTAVNGASVGTVSATPGQ